MYEKFKNEISTLHLLSFGFMRFMLTFTNFRGYRVDFAFQLLGLELRVGVGVV